MMGRGIIRKYSEIHNEHPQIVEESLAMIPAIARQALIGVFAEHGRWDLAGSLQSTDSLIADSFIPYTRGGDWASGSDWDAAVYYFRRGGLKGRVWSIKLSRGGNP
jgi:hypothetical protein